MQALPKFDRLDRVLGIGEQLTISGIRLSILSLELYEDGFLVHARAQVTEGPDLALGRVAVSPNATELALRVTDDSGRAYRPLSYGAGGTSTDYRWQIAFTPLLDPGSRFLTLEVSGIRLRRYSTLGSDELVDDDRGGPCKFEISLR